ncbi:hypothetical protein ASD16_05965 [Cellulomonas sp. Root485]|uniref:eCIS core domain-containing protein n=1 Tax=Cellulomonas sp. Root485 TaxID=1736546 RepID=UPI0006F2F02C|nr:DUF4157 domain-containing protein [Cellulomonas sp. Root485]KQY25005.1 hypothetical protein ASD16_05965 [Cellulomonas sp. Root485]
MTATLTRDALVKEPAAAERGRGRPAAAARGGVPTSNAGMARLARDGGAARANLVGTGGNRVARSTLAVSHPHDPAEREAEALASRVAHGASPPVALARTLEPAVARTLVSRDDAPAPAADVAAGGDVEVSTAVSSLIASPGAGAPMDPAVQAKVEPHLGADLGAVRVHQGPEVAAAAAELHARAFTVGADIFLGEGESSADLELMAHEATHVVQQQAVAVYRDLEVTDLLPDFIIDGVTSAAREIPGYTLLTVITGKDPLTDEPATVSRTEFVEKLLTFGPFGAAVGPLLQTIDVLGDIVTLLMDALAAHNLTLSRIGHDISAAWDEMGVTEGIDGNVAIVERYVDAIVADIRAFVSDVIDAVIEKVREVVADVAEPLLQRPEIAPYWNLAKKVFHHDPLRDEDVSAPTVEILGDFLRLAGRDEVLAQMTERGTLQETADWLDQQWAVFTDLLSRTGALFADAWAAISPENLPNLIENITSLADRAFTLLQDVGAFASTILLKVLELVKKSLLGWASEHAHRVPGFHLLTVILERNPFTDEAVPRTAENLIKGFITLLPGGEAMYDELAESGVIGDAAATIESAMTRLNISWDLITGTFLAIWNTVSLESLLAPIETFDRIVAAFGDPLNRIAEFVSVVIQVVVRLILELMNFPSELLGNIIANATAAIEDIKNDPVGFLKNVVAAMKAGFEGFFGNIANYLLEGLSGWLFRGLRGLGIEPPTSLSVENIITLVIQVLGVTTETLWTKLGERIGPERVTQIRGALDQLSGAWTFIKDVQERGITAVWEFIQGQLSNLWDTILTTAKDWIMREIVDRVVTRLLSMLDPTGIMAVINGTIAFFNAVQSAIDYLRELLEIVDQYVSTIASVARGDVAPGAAMLERGLASAVPVAIGFLANQVGLGNVPEKVQEIIVGLRELVDQALDWLFDQAMALGRAALDALTGAGGAAEEPVEPPAEADFADVVVDEHVTVDGTDHTIKDDGADHALVMHSAPTPLQAMAPTSAALTALIADYDTKKAAFVAARQAWSAWRADRTQPQPARNLSSTRRDLVAAVQALMDFARTLSGGNPGASAPGIGEIAPYGDQPPRIRPTHASLTNDDPVWQGEAEHILPFSIGREMWRQLRLLPTIRGEIEDRQQPTIVIYYNAARLKTPGDVALIAAARASATRASRELVDALVIARDMRRSTPSGPVEEDELYGPRLIRPGLLEGVVDAMFARLDGDVGAAVGRTVAAVDADWGQPDPDPVRGHGATWGARRGESAAVPGDAAVADAAQQQKNAVKEMVLNALQASFDV